MWLRLEIIALATALLVYCGPGELEPSSGVPSIPGFRYQSSPWVGDRRVVSERRPSVVLIVLDTTRADLVMTDFNGCRTTPFLDELAKESLVFADASSTSSWTLPAHASLFSGTYSYQHGVHWNRFPNPSLQDAGGYASPLPEGAVTLAEIFAANGYATLGVSANIWVTPAMGFAQGFDHYLIGETVDAVRRYQPGKLVIDAAMRLLEQQEDRPYFLFVNLMDAHAPYFPEAEAVCCSRGMTATGDDDSRLVSGDIYGSGLRVLVNRNRYRPSRPLQELLRALQADEVRYLDSRLADLTRALHESGRYENTILAIVGDHGEYMFEHEMVNHGIGVYEPVLRVPLLIRYPGLREPRAITDRVELIDVFPTLLALAGVDARRAGLKRLPEFAVNLVDDEARARGRAGLAETYRNPLEEETARPELLRTTRAVVADGYKLIRVSDGPGGDELYALDQDPLEAHNLSGDPAFEAIEQRLNVTLDELLSGEITRGAGSRPSKMSSEDLKTLEALGYLGGKARP